MMKANPITLGFVNLLLCLHCGAFSRFLHPLVLLLHLKRFSCMCRSWEPSTLNHRKCRMIGECNCACMPAQNPFGCDDLFLSASPVSPCTWSPTLDSPSSVFPPRTPFVGLTVTLFPALSLWCCVCVFQFCSVFISPTSLFWFSNMSWTCFSVEESSYLFVVHLFLWLVVFFLQSYAAFLSRGVQIQNYSKIYIYIKCVQPVFLSSCL